MQEHQPEEPDMTMTEVRSETAIEPTTREGST